MQPLIESMGYEFVDLKYGKRGMDWVLQVFADSQEGITLENCKTISGNLGYEFDRHPDLLKHSYSLEVSSPGLDRPLKTAEDFKRYKSRNIIIKLYTPIDNIRMWNGKIVEVKNKNLVIEDIEGKHKNIPIANISKANLKVTL